MLGCDLNDRLVLNNVSGLCVLLYALPSFIPFPPCISFTLALPLINNIQVMNIAVPNTEQTVNCLGLS